MEESKQSGTKDVSCPRCGSERVEAAQNWHHFLCAYIGPAYDFRSDNGAFYCPKCTGRLQTEAEDWEVVGQSYCCRNCGREFIDNQHDA
jgi:transposase-like protein